MNAVRFLDQRSAVLFIGLLCLLFVPASAAAAESGMTVTLDKVYDEKGMQVSSIEVVDLADPSVSQAELLPTNGNDVKTIAAPEMRHLTRSFTKDTATVRGVTVTLNSALKEPVTIGATDVQVYTAPHVPTPKLVVPGTFGNPFIGNYNNSFACPEGKVGLGDLLSASECGYMYVDNAVIYGDPSEDQYILYGGADTSQFKKDDLGYTLTHNEVDLSSFSADSQYSSGISETYAYTTPSPGKYVLTAVRYLPGDQKVWVLASYPVVILEKDTSLTWNGKAESSSFYYGKAADVALSFQDRADVAHTGYLIIRQGTAYDLDVKVDVDALVSDAKAHADMVSPSVPLLDLLAWGATHEVGKDQPVTYTVTAVGKTTPAPTNTWSEIAITPGYGCSGHAAASSATVPKAALNTLGVGTYSVYAVGLTADYEIVAIDQKTLTVKKESSGGGGGGGGGGSPPPAQPDTTGPSTPGADLQSSFSLSGATFETTEEGQTFSIDLDEASRVKVEGNTITFKKNGLTYVITATGLATSDNTVAGTVESVTVRADPLETEVENLGDVSARFTAEFSSFPEGATIGATLVEDVTENVASAYSLALLDEGLDVSEIAYTLKVTKRGIETSGPATITMTVPPEWVTNRGGVGQIRILRLADDGTTQVLETVFKGYDTDGQYVFEAASPDGLSEIGLVAVTAATAVTVQPTDVGAGAETPTTLPAGGDGTTAEEGLPVGLIAVVLVAIVAIAAVGYYLQKKN